ncbi:MAG: hypothetical protein HY736_06465 [Verrucomicrobia bacterium]|nr:hypothetical protein [Verrucomicrobiota bacterium]
MSNEKTLLHISTALLDELSLLFENAKGGPLPYEATDAGFNCYAKAFVTCYLARLQGIAADHCDGRAFLVLKRPENLLTCEIEPHAWSGSRWGEAFDLSINHFVGQNYITAGHVPLAGVKPVVTHVTADARQYARWCTSGGELPDGSHLILHLMRWERFRFGDLQRGAQRVKSPPTQAIAARYKNNNVLAKAILHLHWLVGGRCEPLRSRTQDAAWDYLAAWQVEPVRELRAAWHAAWHGRGWRAPGTGTPEAILA